MKGKKLLRGASLELPAQQTKADRKRFEEIKAKAEKGVVEAQFNLGVCYHEGAGVAKDAARAVKWFRRAAKQGDAESQNNLGSCYVDGVGVAKDDTEAVKWYRKAAEQGYAIGQFNLGLCDAKGEGGAKDYVEAHKCFNLASAQSHENAKKALSIVERLMTAGQIAEAQRLAREFKPRKAPEPGASPPGQPRKP